MSFVRRIYVGGITCIVLAGIAISVYVIYRDSVGQSASTDGVQKQEQQASGSQSSSDVLHTQGLFVATSSSETAHVPEASPAPVAPDITARAYLVGDVSTGEIYIQHNIQQALPVASMSKLITAIVAIDTIAPTATITITPSNLAVATDTSMVTAGESFSRQEILYPLLLNSSNIAAEAIASSSDRYAFFELMKGYAWEVGASTAFFADPSGLSPLNSASAHDMFALARYLYTYRPDILAITRTVSTTTATTTEHGAHIFASTHPFVRDPRFIGGKTGRTAEARETMMTILTIDGHPLVFIVLASQFGERASDTYKLIDKLTSSLH